METPRTTAVDVERAFLTIVNLIHETEEERTGIINTFGRTLAQPVVAHTNIPPHNTATKDGYAAIAENTIGASDKEPRNLSILTETASASVHLQHGTVVRVKSRGVLPPEADTVIDAAKAYRPDSDPEVLIMAECKPHENMQLAGSVISEGQVVLQRGALITGFEMGLMASLGLQGVPIRRRPKVAIITTGASTVDILEKMDIGKARNNSRYLLVGMVLESGCDLGKLVHVKEGRIALEKAITECKNCDAIIVSLGNEDKHDSALAALKNVSSVYFDRVHMEPGSASAFGIIDEKPVFIAPAKAIIESFEALIRPGLLRLLGRSSISRIRLHAALQNSIRLNPGYSHYIKAYTSMDGSTCTARPLGPHAAHAQPDVHPNSLIIVPQNIDFLKKGEDVEVIMIGHG